MKLMELLFETRYCVCYGIESGSCTKSFAATCFAMHDVMRLTVFTTTAENSGKF